MKRAPMSAAHIGYVRRTDMLAGLEVKLSRQPDTRSVSYPTQAVTGVDSVHIEAAKHDHPGQHGTDRDQSQRGHRTLSQGPAFTRAPNLRRERVEPDRRCCPVAPSPIVVVCSTHLMIA